MKRTVLFAVCWLAVVVPDLLAQTFFTGQNASGVIGQADFDTSVFSNQPNRLNGPVGVAFDEAKGKVWVADRLNHRVLRFSSAATAQTGAFPEIVLGQETFTGNLANQGLGAPTARTLNEPRGLAVDALGRLWIVDSLNHRVLRYDNAANLATNAPASAVLGQANFTTSTLVPSPTATSLNAPFGVVVGSNDALWVADRQNHRVLRYDNVTGKANGAAADLVLGQTLFTTSTPAAGATGLNLPSFLDLDPDGRLWVSEFGNHRVKRHDNATAIVVNNAPADGVLGQTNFTNVSANAGGATGPAGLNSPIGIHADAKGAVWVCDFTNNRVLRFSQAGTLPDGAPADLVLGKADFVTSFTGHSVNETYFAIEAAGGPGGSILVAEINPSRVIRFDPINVAPTIRLSGPRSRTTRAARLVVRGTATDSDGFLGSMKGTVNNKAVKVAGTTSWSINAPLKVGRNTIKVRSVDNLGLASGFVTATVTRR